MNDAQIALGRAKRIDAACDQFEADLKKGRSPRIDDFVARAADADRDALRSALEAVERELRERSMADTSITQDSVVSAVDPTSERTATCHIISDPIPQAIARFEILGILGAGAYGRVYKARDPQLGREVAIKVPLPSTLASAADKDRFLREARTAATIRHPNICQIFQVGEEDGRPFIVMGIVPGRSLADVLADLKAPLPTKQIARVAQRIAAALAAAHERGIVHRDLKPGNVMFDRERKDIVVMDFGLARGPQLGDARVTQSGVVMGTPAYMCPEQARGDSRAAGPSGDIYSLGVMLYELLTGTRPFVGTATEVFGQILHVDPVPPSQRKADVDPALEAICLKAMAKDPAQRYRSMTEMANALGSVAQLSGASTAAVADTARAAVTTTDTPTSISTTPNMSAVFAAISAERQAQQAATVAAVEAAVKQSRTPKWVWPVVIATILGGFVVLAGITFFTQSRGVRVTIELTDIDLSDTTLSYLLDNRPITAEELSKEIELSIGEHDLIVKRGNTVVNHMKLTVKGKQDRVIKVEHLMPLPPRTLMADKPTPVRKAECPLDYLDPAAIPESERRPWYPSELVAVLGTTGMRLNTLSLAFSRDNTLVAAGGEQERSVKVWEVATGKELMHLPDFPGWVTGVVFSPNGKLLYAGSGDEIRVINRVTKETLHTWRGQRGGLAALALSADGKLLAAAGGGQYGVALGNDLELWDTTTGQKLRTAKGVFTSVAFSPDGKTLAVGYGGAGLWDVDTLKERKRLADATDSIWVAFSGNGQYLAVAGNTDTKARVYEAASGNLVRTIACNQGNLGRVAFQANGQVLATGGDNGTVKLWETTTGQVVRTIPHAGELAMTPDGQTLATGSVDGVRLWESATGRELFPRAGDVHTIAVSPDGATVATGGATTRLWDARTGKMRQSLILHRGSVNGVAFSPDGTILATGSSDGTVRLWDAATRDERKTLTAGASVGSVAFSRDGRMLAAALQAENNEIAKIWDVSTGELRHTFEGRYDPGTRPFLRRVVFSPTEPLLATNSVNEILLWDPVTHQKLADLTIPNNEVNDIAFSPDGRHLTSCYFFDTLKVWDVATRKAVHTLSGHRENLSGVAWSPDGKWLASAGADGTVRLWEAESGAPSKVFRLHNPTGHLGRLTFSPEGRHLLVDSGHGTVLILRLWSPGESPQ